MCGPLIVYVGAHIYAVVVAYHQPPEPTLMATNRSLYVQDTDEALWERAARVAKARGVSLSALVTTAIARDLADQHTLEVKMYAARGGSYRLVQFEGRWLTDPKLHSDDVDAAEAAAEPHASAAMTDEARRHARDVPEWTRRTYRGEPHEWLAAIAETGRGRIAVYLHHWSYSADWPPELHDFDTVDEAERALHSDPRVPAKVWGQARDAQARRSGAQTSWPVEFLQI